MIVKNLCCVLNRNTGIHFEIARAQENGLKCLRMYVVVILWTQHQQKSYLTDFHKTCILGPVFKAIPFECICNVSLKLDWWRSNL